MFIEENLNVVRNTFIKVYVQCNLLELSSLRCVTSVDALKIKFKRIEIEKEK